MARTILITGANRGIGLGLAEMFLKSGDFVYGTARDPKSADQLEQLRKKFPEKCKVIALDVENTSSIELLSSAFGKNPLDILINNAGVLLDRGDGFETVPIEKISQTLATNTFGPFLVTRTLLPLLKKSKQPVVISITSQMGSISDNKSGGYYAYRMSKAALNMFNRSLSADYPKFICVVLHPGWVQTEMGGKQAAIKVEDCVAGLCHVIDGLKAVHTGKFYDFRGAEIPW